MSSDIDICNLALSHLGDEAEVIAIDPPDGTIQASHCGRFYPFARGVLLEMFPWTFATKRIALAELDTNPVEDDWGFAYTLPSTCIRPLSSLYPGQPERLLGTDSDLGSFPYVIEAGADGEPVMYTNVETAVLRYIDLITDTAKYTPGFTVALSRLLASYLAGPILKGKVGAAMAQNQLKLFEIEFRKAAAANANAGRRNAYEQRVPPHVAARGGFSTALQVDATVIYP
ncbi:MAG TPA: hypothetical protein VLJ58_21415 [Ramlibacter sp.]|nr:hypothetical protein [Ramlibacter sp.]